MDAAPAGPADLAATTAASADADAIDISRLRRRLQAYAHAYGIPGHAIRQMDELLATPIATRLLQLPLERLYDFLVLDAYKPKMHVMYDKYLNGVTADFALIVRRAPPAADPARLPSQHPALWAAFEASMASLTRTTPYGPYEVQALGMQFGMELPQSLLERCHRDGVAPVEWQQRHVGLAEEGEAAAAAAAGHPAAAACRRVAVASGPLVAASLVETPLMQRFQELAVAAQVEALRAAYATTDTAIASSLWQAAAAPQTATTIAGAPLPTVAEPPPTAAQAMPIRPTAGASSSSSGLEAQQRTGGKRTGVGPQDEGTQTVSQPQSQHQLLQPGEVGPGPEPRHRRHTPLPPPPPPPLPYDRTERLANSLARLVQTVERINGFRHGCRVALFAGRRSSDLLYLILQNLYCAAHLEGYDGTSSVYVVAVLGRERAAMGVSERERWDGAGRLVGTHAHEQVSALHQLMAPYDAEAGRRCGLPHAVAVTPLLAHLLFLAANGPGGGGGGPGGGGGATALSDTFTTAAFLAVARAAAVPAAFRSDVEASYGWVVPEHARCFDMFRVWRLDSGSFEQVAAQVVGAWEARSEELRREGRPQLPRPLLMNSNLGSVEEIGAVCSAADPRVRPDILAFGTLADGFLPFLEQEEGEEEEEVGEEQRHEEIACGPGQDLAAAAVAGDSSGGGEGGLAAKAAAAANRPTISLASVVMKLVQARPPRPLPPLGGAGGGGGGASTALAAAAAGSDDARRPAPAAPAPPPLPACAIKLGDGDSGKVQVDPRLEPEAAAEALRAAVEMARGSAASAAALDSGAVSAVLAEAYDAVTRRGVLMAVPPPPVPTAAQ